MMDTNYTVLKSLKNNINQKLKKQSNYGNNKIYSNLRKQ